MQIEGSGFTVAAQWKQKGASCLMWVLALKKKGSDNISSYESEIFWFLAIWPSVAQRLSVF